VQAIVNFAPSAAPIVPPSATHEEPSQPSAAVADAPAIAISVTESKLRNSNLPPISTMTYKDLQRELRERGINAAGKKEVLVSRLASARVEIAVSVDIPAANASTGSGSSSSGDQAKLAENNISDPDSPRLSISPMPEQQDPMNFAPSSSESPILRAAVESSIPSPIKQRQKEVVVNSPIPIMRSPQTPSSAIQDTSSAEQRQLEADTRREFEERRQAEEKARKELEAKREEEALEERLRLAGGATTSAKVDFFSV